MRNSIPFRRVWAPSAAGRRHQDSRHTGLLEDLSRAGGLSRERRDGANIAEGHTCSVASASVGAWNYQSCFCVRSKKWTDQENTKEP